jgi:NAD+ diphosphatase
MTGDARPDSSRLASTSVRIGTVYPLDPTTGMVFRRDATSRHDPKQLEALWHNPHTRVLYASNGSVAVTHDGQLALAATQGEIPDAAWYLGKVGDPHDSDRPETAIFQYADDQLEDTAEYTWRPLLEVLSDLSAVERDIANAATALAHWHGSAAYSPRTGEQTFIADAGWARKDDAGREYFPRTDPAVIVRIEHNNRILLGSNVLWPTGRFSLLAGFVEAGESAEDAVRRETFEESGMRLGRVEYLRSQPWPFPRSLMLGFRAQLHPDQDPTALIPEPEEITELRWFRRDEVAEPPPGITLPMGGSLAAILLQDWVEQPE